MKNYLIIILLVTLISCRKENAKPIVKVESDKISIKNEVVFTLKRFLAPLSINIKSSSLQIKPDIVTISNIDNQNSIVVPTDSIVNVFIGHRLYMVFGTFMKGDSVLITNKNYYNKNKKIQYPYLNISNRKVNPFELNFDYYVAKKTHTKYSFPLYYRFASIINKNNKIETYKDVYDNTIRINDSLFMENLISKDFYNKELQEIKIFKANFLLKKALKEERKITIDSLGISISNDSLYNNKLYINYLITTVKYSYFFNTKKRISNTDIFNAFIDKKGFTKYPILKKAIVNKLLSSIYESPKEKKYFEKCLKKLNQEEFPLLTKKFKTILANEKRDKDLMVSLKNSTGKLLFLDKIGKHTIGYQEVLKNSTGKVILVDFWASWCAPCRKEIPSLRKLKSEIDSSKFTVISISTDKKISAWKNASEVENLENENNFLLINSKKSSLVKDYKIFTIPRYLLYNKKGELINANAPRPSSKELKILINKYLNN